MKKRYWKEFGTFGLDIHYYVGNIFLMGMNFNLGKLQKHRFIGFFFLGLQITILIF